MPPMSRLPPPAALSLWSAQLAQAAHTPQLAVQPSSP
eukprot:CAMPEP_0172894892 /NCGR_PEP_ID=MMETSP1075-20121228/151882_1 /TAXON_ID=2916 /ORGANISM="Ceratium fusus, Strain PA161109" /LENGTH=36 /DNA_ID= /DNA_START= /DNA_END= /DNA_ORIENTATION=